MADTLVLFGVILALAVAWVVMILALDDAEE